MAYGSTDGVSALIPAVGQLGMSSLPTLAQVQAWLSEGNSVINRTLAGRGYAVPVAATALAYGELTSLANLYAAAHAVMARGLDTVQGTEENRAQVWLDMFYSRLAALADAGLSDVPVTTVTPTGGRRLRFTQMKRVDGYSRVFDDADVDI